MDERIDDFGYGFQKYKRVKYFLVEDIQPGGCGGSVECGARAVASTAKPDENGFFPLVNVICEPVEDDPEDFKIVDIDEDVSEVYDADAEVIVEDVESYLQERRE